MTRLSVFIISLILFSHQAMAQTVDGILEPVQDVYVKTTIDGIVTDIAVQEGEGVHAGELLVSFDASEQAAKVTLAQSIANATAGVETAKKRAALAKRKYNDLDEARKNGAATDWEVQDAQATKSLAALDLVAAREEKLANQQRLMLEKEILDRYRFTAPFDGLLTEVFVTQGQSVSRGEKVARLVNTDTLKIEAFVEAQHHSFLVKGKPYQASMSSPFDRNFEVTLTHIDAVFDPATRTIRVVFNLDNDQQLPAGVDVEVSLVDKLSLSFPE